MKTDKEFRCTVCKQPFTRSDHLKRHHLRHTGKKPYFCEFCNETFARCDNLRDHYPDCAKRGEHEIPENTQRGRRRHACQSCILLKLRCDGESPCQSCYKKDINCNNVQASCPKNSDIEKVKSASTRQNSFNQSSDRESVKFLLNGGTDSFTETFRHPPCEERPRGLIYHTQTALHNEVCDSINQHMESQKIDPTLAFMDSSVPELQLFQDDFLGCFNGPFSVGHKSAHNGSPYHDLSSGQFADHSVFWKDTIFEPEPPFVMALAESILARGCTVLTDANAREDLSTNLIFLLTTARIRKFIAFYFTYWHPSCAMVHEPTLDMETMSVPLLASMVFMGAMYSTDQKELTVAKRVLDFVELFIFSNNVFSPESVIEATFTGDLCNEDGLDDWVKFQNFQAGLLITVVQYWAGSRVSRDRAIESRFSEVVKVARRIELVKTRHQPQEWASEHLWIQEECHIRTISILSLLDCAFFFYQNYPCRLTFSEMEFELPCKESIFQAKHPFSEPHFRFSRGTTISKTFQGLFDDNTVVGCRKRSLETSHMDLTILDMFILIHLLYVFINMQMSTLGPFIRRSHFDNNVQGTGDSGPDTSLNSDGSVLDTIRKALFRWRDHWVELCSQVSQEEWASLGFCKNAYSFWLVSRLLVTQKDYVDVFMRMGVNCGDKLQELNVLLLDERD